MVEVWPSGLNRTVNISSTDNVCTIGTVVSAEPIGSQCVRV